MPQSLLKDGRTVNNWQIVDFDEKHTNSVNALTDEERALFVESEIPDAPPPPPPPEPTPQEKLESIGLTDDVLAALKLALGIK